MTPLAALIDAELGAPVPAPVRAAADAARARFGEGVRAVLFHGSCLRDGYADGALADLYLLADGYASVHPRPLARLLNRLVPPNVYLVEAPHGPGTVRAKCALVSLPQLERLVGPATRNPYFWARFAQPAALVWARDPEARARVRDALALAAATAFRAARPLPGEDAEDVWSRAFAETYRTELRAERPGRARAIVAHDAARYRRVAALLPPPPAGGDPPRPWRLRRVEGKALSLLRLAKASFTFAGGLDYVAWKIERHAGAPVALTGWQRRHPLLAAPLLLWRLRRSGAVR